LPDQLLFASLMADNARSFYRDLVAYLHARTGLKVRLIEDAPWQECEQRLHQGSAQLGAVCGLQYVYAVDRGAQPGLELLAAPVMQDARYENRPVYFSEVVVRRDNVAASLADLRGSTWAYNEPTSQSGYAITRYVLASRGEPPGFFGRVIASGAHQHSLALLLAGAVDATAIDSTVLDTELVLHPELAARIRVVETLGPSPIPPLVISRAVPVAVRRQLESTLMTMHADPAGLQVLSGARVKQFVRVTDADYEPIRAMARVAQRYDSWLDAPVLSPPARLRA
jgi:phosphonate transport system substrate-binding protein